MQILLKYFEKEDYYLKSISKSEGKALNATHPQYIYCTQHKRHYYIEESRAAMKLLAEYRSTQPKPIYVYPEPEV